MMTEVGASKFCLRYAMSIHERTMYKGECNDSLQLLILLPISNRNCTQPFSIIRQTQRC